MADDEVKVVRVLSDFEVVINAGSKREVRPGARVEIYTLGEMITDPESGEELERLKIVRGVGRVTTLQEKIATVRSAEKVESPKTIRRTVRSPLEMFSYGNVVEESRGPEEAPFREPQIGDLVRFI